MKLNFRPERVAYIDFETQSEYDLNKGTARAYSKHPSTKALTCVVKCNDNVFKMGPYLNETDLYCLQEIAKSYTLVAHNAPFDAAIWENTLGLPEAEWFDTLPCARAAGLPGGLDKLSLAIGGRGKHKDGKRLIEMLCIVRNGKIPAVGPAHKLLLDYNVQDVEELEVVYNRVKSFGDPAAMAADRVINSRGIPIDIELVRALDSMYVENVKRHGATFDEATDGVNPKSPKQVLAWLETLGIQLRTSDGKASVGKQVVSQFLEAPESFCSDDAPADAGILQAAKEALELRRELAGVGRGKVDAALRCLDEDGKIRDQFVYFGAHTGRFSSRGLQLHNMPSALKAVDMRDVEPTYEAVNKHAEDASAKLTDLAGHPIHVTVSDCLNVMLRRIVKADNLNVADYGAVEARCVAWLANSKKMLAAFNDPHSSVYLDMGDAVFQRRINKKKEPLEYVLCKALVLGCGYGMSGAKFDATCRLRESRQFMDMIHEAHIDLASMVKLYRKTYPEIPALWSQYGEALHSAVSNVPCEAGRCKFYMVSRDLHVELPSGRPIVYRNARMEMMVPMYCKMYRMPEIPVPTVVYDNPRGYNGFLYGARVCENISQGVCSDLLADAIVQVPNVIVHVHDEILAADNESQLHAMIEIMSVGPAWAAGFPILVEGYAGPQWTKNPAGYKELRMLGGIVCA